MIELDANIGSVDLIETQIVNAAGCMKEGVVGFLEELGAKENSEIATNTPERVRRAWVEFLSGYAMDVNKELGPVFDDTQYDEIVMVRDIGFSSMCEHHLLPFGGVAHVGYLPQGNRVVGLSKLARVVEVFARRLQIQERMTQAIANALTKKIDPQGVVVVIEASHACMACRGVRQRGSSTITSVMTGKFREFTSARAEVMSLIRR